MDKMLVWVCPNCEFKIPMEPHEFPIRCRCGFFGVMEEAVYINKRDWIKRPPHILKTGTNFIQATIKDAKYAWGRVTEKQYNERLEICDKCEFCIHRKITKQNGETEPVVHRCAHEGCGCFLKTKAWRTAEKCPEGFWPEND